jgi:iron(III) transport system substrate-binding protein
MTMRAARLLPIAGLALLAACGGPHGPDGDAVNVYSHRHYEADQQLFDRFTERTGIRVNVVTASADELITRLENEGAASPADVLITVDAGRLYRAKARGLLQAVSSDVLEANVPGHLRDRDRHWWGLTQRARVLAYHRERVDPAELDGYETLADERWRGRILVRSSENVYNQSMLAALIAHHGEDAAERWARGIVANMARRPSGGDTDQVKAVAAGVGDVAIVNTYYVARLAESANPQERRVAEQIGVFFPNQSDYGTHVNVSGAGITRHARNAGHALALLEFLTGPEAQALFAETNQEYPVNPQVPWSGALQGWGEFRADTLDLTRLGELNDAAVRVFDRAGWR